LGPQSSLETLFILALGVAFFSATQDIVSLAYQVERLGKKRYGPGEAMSTFGYRMGMLTGGAGSLYLLDQCALPWGQVYEAMAVVAGLGVVLTLCIAEPKPLASPEARLKEEQGRTYLKAHPRLKGWQANILSWLYGAVICPFVDYVSSRKNWQHWLVPLLIMFFYKLSDNIIGTMTNVFFLDLGFSASEIASASKVFGMISSILGGFMGGLLIVRLGMQRSLFFCALIHGVTILLYALLSQVGHNVPLLYAVVGIEHITSGMRTTALLTYQMTLVNPVYAATQLALLVSLVNLGRTAFSAFSGALAQAVGWTVFFEISAASTIFSLILVAFLAKLKREEQTTQETLLWQPAQQGLSK
jgi:PAT family beta-lactamase induction signal transducer AmpG